MFELKKIKKNNKIELTSIKEIYENSFPPDERRDFNLVIDLLKNKTFSLNAILFENKAIGLLSYWHFDQFIYIEHFAIHENFRNNGVGSFIINNFVTQNFNKQILLETEIPIDRISLRRIEFYKRFGFIISTENYIQPPYDKTKEAVPMLIMSKPEIESNTDFETIKRILYKNVYFANML